MRYSLGMTTNGDLLGSTHSCVDCNGTYQAFAQSNVSALNLIFVFKKKT